MDQSDNVPDQMEVARHITYSAVSLLAACIIWNRATPLAMRSEQEGEPPVTYAVMKTADILYGWLYGENGGSSGE